jgi:hypothetical protein
MTTQPCPTINRLASLIQTEHPSELAEFVAVLGEVRASAPDASLQDLLKAAAARFPLDGLDLEAHASGDLAYSFAAKRAMYEADPIGWPLLVRYPGVSDGAAPQYALVDDPASADGGASGCPAGELIDWLEPGRDDVCVVVSLFQTALERDAYVNGWRTAGPPDGAARHGLATPEIASGFVALTWKHDARNLLVWRDLRAYECGTLLSVVFPGGHSAGRADIPAELFEEFV